jgi:hypothetical protein
MRALAAHVLALLALLACSSTPENVDGMSLAFASPTEDDAIPLTGNYRTKADVREGVGEPTSTKVLDAAADQPCVERWFYKGTAKTDIGPLELLMYIDFDENGFACKPAKGA